MNRKITYADLLRYCDYSITSFYQFKKQVRAHEPNKIDTGERWITIHHPTYTESGNWAINAVNFRKVLIESYIKDFLK